MRLEAAIVGAPLRLPGSVFLVELTWCRVAGCKVLELRARQRLSRFESRNPGGTLGLRCSLVLKV